MKIHYSGKPALEVENPIREQIETLLSYTDARCFFPSVKGETWIEYDGVIEAGCPLIRAHKIWSINNCVFYTLDLAVGLLVGAIVKLFKFTAVEPVVEFKAGVSTKPADGALVNLFIR